MTQLQPQDRHHHEDARAHYSDQAEYYKPPVESPQPSEAPGSFPIDTMQGRVEAGGELIASELPGDGPSPGKR